MVEFHLNRNDKMKEALRSEAFIINKNDEISNAIRGGGVSKRDEI